MSAAKKIIASTSGVGGAGLNVEDVFNTHMYLGTGSSQNKYNYIDLLNEGGLVWFKRRNGDHEHGLYDTARGTGKRLSTNNTSAEETDSNGLSAFRDTGFTVVSADDCNGNSDTYASWAFRKAPKFFDIVTYTGNGASSHSIAHNLECMPGFIVIKRRDSGGGWHAIARYGDDNYLGGGSTNSFGFDNTAIANNGVSPSNRGITTTHFDVAKTYGGVGSFDVSKTNTNNATYVAYLWAHNDDDGGYGPNGDLDIIKCGSFSTAGSGSSLVGANLGWEPQWVMFKNAGSTQSGDWWIVDSHRGFYSMGYDSNTGKTRYLRANVSSAESNFNNNTLNLTSTGFTIPSNAFSPGQFFIYVAIRRGPTKEAESGPEVFGINAGGGTNYFSAGGITYSLKSPDDMVIVKRRDSTTPADQQWAVTDRIRGIEPWTSWTTASTTTTPTFFTHSTNGESVSGSRAGKYPGTTGNGGGNASSTNILTTGLAPGISYWWRRSPGFFDIISYAGNGSASQTLTHNLQGAPKMVWGKRRDSGGQWLVYYGVQGRGLFLNSTTNYTGITFVRETGTTSDVITSTTGFDVILHTGGNAGNSLNTSGEEYILYLFGEQTGISKIGTYEGTGSDLNIDCGFAARWVMIRDVSAGSAGQGGWLVYDTTRGINAGSDPFISFNTTAAEASADYIDPHSSGFTVVGGQTHNVDDHNYLFYAIA